MSEDSPNIDTCDFGHRFAKLQDHPTKDGKARCPHCMAVGLELARKEAKKAEKGLIRGLIPAGVPCPYDHRCPTNSQHGCRRNLNMAGNFSCGAARAYELFGVS